jgi:hypothetical protein
MDSGASVVVDSVPWDYIESLSGSAVESSAGPSDPAHILFFSGSTGTPKGVVITGASVIHFIRWAVSYFEIAPQDRISGHPPLHFDLSTFDIYGTIAAGAQIHLVPPEVSLLPHRLAGYIRDSGLTQWFSVPSALLAMAKYDVLCQNDFPSLRRLLWCGEKFPVTALTYFMKRLPMCLPRRKPSCRAFRAIRVQPLSAEVRNSKPQVAMLGLDPALGRSAFFEEELPRIATAYCPGVPYIPSSPCGAGLPFHPRSGVVAHYFGVGAYRRLWRTVRRAEVRFASECLALANVAEPVPASEAALATDGMPAPADPAPKGRAPRDPGSDWDFHDVRDHYLNVLYVVDPAGLRTADPARYWELSRIVSGEVMAEVFGEWRRPASTCRGGIVLWSADLAPGAGWGILDSQGRPKPAYWFLNETCFSAVHRLDHRRRPQRDRYPRG